MKKILVIFLSLFLALARIFAVDVSITNGINDIISSKNIGIRFTFDAQTQAILCSTIHFSVDNPAITVQEWFCAERPITQFLPNFKRSKKVFIKSFNCELKITINSKKNDQNDLINILKNSNLHVSCISISNDGQTKTVNSACSIDEESTNSIKASQNNEQQIFSTSSQSNIYQNSTLKKLPSYKKIEAEQENVILDKLKDLWAFSSERIIKFINKIDFFIFYLFIIVFIILFLILIAKYSLAKRFLSGPVKILIFTCIILSYFFLKPFLLPYKFYFGLAFLLILTAFYYIFSAKTNSVKDKLKSLLGFILAALAIPLIVKAFLLLKNLS